MKESHRKGLASHSGPESCVGTGNCPCEALTGVHVGQVLSCEITFVLGADAVERSGKPHRQSVLASSCRTQRSRRP